MAIPGNMLPKENHLAIPNLDKYVHIICLEVLFFYGHFIIRQNQKKKIIP